MMNSQCTATLQSGSRLAALPARAGSRQARPCRPFFSAPLLHRSLICTASTSDKESTKKETKVVVPDTPPAGPSPPKPKVDTQPQGEDAMSIEGIQQRAAQLQAAQQQQQETQQQQPAKDSLWQGVLEEVFLIKWPSPKQAILNTLLVIVIVGGTSALLFAVNTLLAELSRVIYG